MTVMAEHQHIHQHYHHVVTEPDVPYHQQVAANMHANIVAWFIFLGCVAIFGLAVSGALLPILLYGVLPIVAIVVTVRLIARSISWKLAERQKLIVDADHQHRQVMSGDDAGVYGNFPPAC